MLRIVVTTDQFAFPIARPRGQETRVGRVCHAVRLGAVAWAMFDLAPTLFVLNDRSGLLLRLSAGLGFDPLGVTDARYAVFAALISLASAVDFIVVFAVWRLMGAYLAGDIFSESAARALFRVGLAGIAATVLAKIAAIAGFWSLAGPLSWSAMTGIAVSPDDLLYYLLSAFLMALGAALRTAGEIVTEHAEFV